MRNSIPLYLNPESPFCKPIMSHNASSHNVVLKITVPKRTGRRRKKDSNEPWQGDMELPDARDTNSKEEVQSIARRDEPKVLRRKLQDNVGKYQVEAVGVIKHTHRFRALADFYWDMNRSEFAQRYAEQVLPGDGLFPISCAQPYGEVLTVWQSKNSSNSLSRQEQIVVPTSMLFLLPFSHI